MLGQPLNEQGSTKQLDSGLSRGHSKKERFPETQLNPKLTDNNL